MAEAKVEKVTVGSDDTLVGIVSHFIGQPVAVLCARYQYRGILSKVAKDGSCIVISDAKSVEVSGPSSATKPNTEDEIASDVMVKLDAVEIVYQPRWCFEGYTG